MTFDTDYEEIALTIPEGPRRQMFILYMNERWPNGDVSPEYAHEWAWRFKKRYAYAKSDQEGRRVLREIATAHPEWY